MITSLFFLYLFLSLMLDLLLCISQAGVPLILEKSASQCQNVTVLFVCYYHMGTINQKNLHLLQKQNDNVAGHRISNINDNTN